LEEVPVTTRFETLYNARVAEGLFICLGLDPDVDQIPECVEGETDAERVYNFLVPIIKLTHHMVAAVKPQIAYYEALGDDGAETLRRLIEVIRELAPTLPIILDFKRADIGRTNEAYVATISVGKYDVDAVTVHPYLGMVAMQPFLDREDVHIIVLCRTSNPGAGEFQDVECRPWRDDTNGYLASTLAEARRELGDDFEGSDWSQVSMTLYQFVAHRVAQSWNRNGNCAVVVGATYADKELAEVRAIVGDMIILIPGIGTQGGDLAASIQHGQSSGGWDVVLNNSSAILFAYKKIKAEGLDQLKYVPEQWAEASLEAITSMHTAIEGVLAQPA
jgi:orotidine-5'-phosphate decarboxylase